MSRGAIPDPDSGQLPAVHLTQRPVKVEETVRDAHGAEEASVLQPSGLGNTHEGVPGVEEDGQRRRVRRTADGT